MLQRLADFEKIDTVAQTTGHCNEKKEEEKDIKTYNILLEFGAMDLCEYFVRTLPPVLPPEIELFWSTLFAIPDAVKGVHNLNVDNPWVEEEYYGYASDSSDQRTHTDITKGGMRISSLITSSS